MNATQVLNWQKIRARYFSDIHYELPQDYLFVPMLGKTRAYSSGYWKEGIQTLDEAQEAKFDNLIQKQGLKEGDTVIEFGCGSGSYGYHAGKKGIQVIGLNICKEQLRYANEHNDTKTPAIYLNFNLVTQSAQQLADILWNNYGIDKVDAALFVGSIEHVGWKNYTNLFQKLHSLLKLDGIMGVHTIGSYQPLPVADPYIMTKIFPDSQLAVGSKLLGSAEKAGFHLADWHNLEKELHSYAKTLRWWLFNFQQQWDTIKPYMPHKDKEAFYREWIFYLMLCIGAFEADNFINVGHYMFQKTNSQKLYIPIR
jgi:cyclopropane-fatty-acyl-phospholipid synthase